MIYILTSAQSFVLGRKSPFSFELHLLRGGEKMKVKFVLRDGQTITTNSFKNGLEDYLYRALGEADSTSVATLKAKDGIFLVRMTDVVSIKIPS